MGVPQNGWFLMEIPTKIATMDDLELPPFYETTKSRPQRQMHFCCQWSFFMGTFQQTVCRKCPYLIPKFTAIRWALVVKIRQNWVDIIQKLQNHSHITCIDRPWYTPGHDLQSNRNLKNRLLGPSWAWVWDKNWNWSIRFIEHEASPSGLGQNWGPLDQTHELS